MNVHRDPGTNHILLANVHPEMLKKMIAVRKRKELPTIVKWNSRSNRLIRTHKDDKLVTLVNIRARA